ncbi:Thoeris anti-defense Tad2 family protein [Xenorhabdus szentirmaii]|uniref:Thoeris anti-defense 2-like domain-containing protein n=1 Tax=Xenorhabdus szentirmaii DSM 16338 TaxID=1427518 RepID=W1J589_9GAMM|nr:hypothetical protein [Xenorhabdus szentirmaii]PHM30382.1 hypothetical protein Xsze_04222 [Xenorhabdus szentirmaii DSM 16338]CDL85238.1 hypothetical protein XSR1_680012 [Xenorhabdus szentirmaii DSM 16338]
MIRRATSDYAQDLSEEQKSILNRLFAAKWPTHSERPHGESTPNVRLMDYPAALSLMIRRDSRVYRMNWAGGHVKLHSDKRRKDDRAEFLFISPEGISISWHPSVQDQLADNWAVCRA